MRGFRTFPLSALVLGFLFSVPGLAAAQGTILSASYGFGNSRVDVTNKVQSLVQPNGRLYFRITTEALGVRDPAPGRTKELRIQMRQPNGQMRDYQFQEKGYVDIQVGFAGGAGGTITSASYGYGNSRIDVANKVQSLVQPDGRLYFRITTETLGVRDPAPGRAKDLRIQVRQLNGQMRDYQFQEKGYVDIMVAGGGPGQPGTPSLPNTPWQGDPVATCINAVRARIQQDFGNQVSVYLPATAARVNAVPPGQLFVPVTGTGQITPPRQAVINTQYNCQIDKRFGTVNSVNYSNPNVSPQPR
ncbi:MAG TPA: hypothetical protein VEI01_19660 [Terriglobales bacterium]|nr:hypothetical protein [Terriglobales bacterium]